MPSRRWERRVAAASTIAYKVFKRQLRIMIEQEQEQERIVKGIWIPIEIWKDKNLNWNEKILLLEIDSFTSLEKDCYFSDEYIAQLLGISTTNANKTLSSLIKKGYVVKTKFDGRRRYVKAVLSILTTLPCQNRQPSFNLINKDNNKGLNNKKEKEKKEDKSSLKEQENLFVERMYSLYPTKCPVRGVSLGKTSKDKVRLHSLLKKYSMADIERVITLEVKNKYGKYNLRNFSTFLNNFPDPSQICENTTPQQGNLFNNLPVGMIITESSEERNKKLENEKGW